MGTFAVRLWGHLLPARLRFLVAELRGIGPAH